MNKQSLFMAVLIIFCCFCDSKKSIQQTNGNRANVEAPLAAKEASVVSDTCGHYALDTAVGGIILHDVVSSEAILGDLENSLNLKAALPYAIFSDHENEVYLKVTCFPGSSKNQVSVFEIGKTVKEDEPGKVMILPKLKTGQGIELGVSLNEVVSRLGPCHEKKEEGPLTKIRYVKEKKSSPFLRRNNMPIYLANYYFSAEKRLVKFDFGFVYP